MSRFFQYLRKRMTKRRFAVLWLCLVGIELFCPVFCDEPAAVAANSSFPEPEIIAQVRESSDPTTSSIESASVSADDQSTTCNDECLCHAAAIPCVVIGTKPSSLRSEPMIIGYANAFSSSLPPPYLPPKFS